MSTPLDSTEAHLWLRGTLAVLACWRITHLLAREDGPWNLLASFRRRLGNHMLGHLMDCFYCLSLWIAAPLAWVAFSSGVDRALGWFAISGGACLLFRMTPEPVLIQPLPATAADSETNPSNPQGT